MAWQWKGKKISKKNVILLFIESKYEEITNQYSKEVLPGEQFFLMNNGEFLIKFPEGNGVIYPTLKDYEDITINSIKDTIPQLPKDFIRQILTQINKLGLLLKMKLSLNDKLDDLEKVDIKLREKGWSKLELDNYVLPLTAYCNQIIINELGGNVSSYMQVGNPNEILIKADNGEKYNPYLIVSGEFVDTPTDLSFSGLVREIIYPSTFLKKNR